MCVCATNKTTYFYIGLVRWWAFVRWWVLWHWLSTNTRDNEDHSFLGWSYAAGPVAIVSLKDKADSYVIRPVICSTVFFTTVDAAHRGARERVGMRWRQKKARPNARARGRDRVFLTDARSQRAFSWRPWRRAVMRKVCAHMDREHGAVKRKGRGAAVIFCLWIRLQQPRLTKEAPVGRVAAEGYLRSNGKLPSALSASPRSNKTTCVCSSPGLQLWRTAGLQELRIVLDGVPVEKEKCAILNVNMTPVMSMSAPAVNMLLSLLAPTPLWSA